MNNTNHSFPEKITIHPSTNSVEFECIPPGSKSITNRALVLAALNTGKNQTVLSGALQSEDTEIMVNCLEKLGYIIKADWQKHTITIQSPLSAGIIPASKAELFTANSGTTMRFLTAMVALGNGEFLLDGIKRMRERPIGDLLNCLNQLGIDASSVTRNDCPPVRIKTKGWSGGNAEISTSTSSQFLSGILMAAPVAKGNSKIHLIGKIVSEPYIELTIQMLKAWGLIIHHTSEREFEIPGNQEGKLFNYHIEPDASAASYFYAMAAITGGTVITPGLGSQSMQGDIHFVEALEKMGCKVEQSSQVTKVTGGILRGIDIDMNAISDTVMTLGVVACFADGPTRIRNIEHIRHKETDRISALATELQKIGAKVEEFQDSIVIHPKKLQAAEITTYNDHRMAMSFAVAGLKVPGITILNPSCVSKTYPRFFEDFSRFTNARLT